MKISTKGIYALEITVDLAIHSQDSKKESIKTIATRRNLSEKYLERIVGFLKKGGILTSTRGAYGGYSLAKEPKDMLISDILIAAEGNLSPVECLHKDIDCGIDCSKCVTRKLWNEMWNSIKSVVNTTTLEQLVEASKTFENES